MDRGDGNGEREYDRLCRSCIEEGGEMRSSMHAWHRDRPDSEEHEMTDTDNTMLILMAWCERQRTERNERASCFASIAVDGFFFLFGGGFIDIPSPASSIHIYTFDLQRFIQIVNALPSIFPLHPRPVAWPPPSPVYAPREQMSA